MRAQLYNQKASTTLGRTIIQFYERGVLPGVNPWVEVGQLKWRLIKSGVLTNTPGVKVEVGE